MFVRHLENEVGEENQMEMAHLGLSYWQFANGNADCCCHIWYMTTYSDMTLATAVRAQLDGKHTLENIS